MKKGFTLIEMIVVIGIIALVLPVIFAIAFGILRQQAKVYALKQVKREGDLLLNIIENTLRTYAFSAHSGQPDETNEVCRTQTSEDAAYFKDKLGNWFRFYQKPDEGVTKISSQSSILNNGDTGETFLTTSKVDLNNSFSMTCSRTSAFSPPIVSVSFNISYNTASDRLEDQATFNFQTKIKLRSY